MDIRIKRILSMILTMIILPVTSIMNNSNAKSETKESSTSATKLDEIDSETVERAIEYLGYQNITKTDMILLDSTITIIKTYNKEEKYVTAETDDDVTIDTYDVGNIPTGKASAFNITTFIDNLFIGQYAMSKRYFNPSEKFFINGEINDENMEFISRMPFADFIRTLKISNERKMAILERAGKEQDIFGIVATMLMTDLELKNWHTTVKQPIIYSKLISNDRSKDFILTEDAWGLISKSDDGSIKITLFERYEVKKGEYRFRELGTEFDSSDTKLKKVSPIILKALGVKKLEKKKNIIFFGNLNNMVNSGYYVELTGPLKEAEIEKEDGLYYNAETLMLLYSLINPPERIDYSWYVPKDINISGRRNAGYDMLAKKNDEVIGKGYTIRRASKNFIATTRVAKNNAENIPTRNIGSIEEIGSNSFKNESKPAYELSPGKFFYIDELPMDQEEENKELEKSIRG